MPRKKDNSKDYNPEFGVDSRYISQEEYQSEAAKLMESRLKKMKGMTPQDLAKTKLMQLKFQMEAFINQEAGTHINQFAEYLKLYIDSIYSTRTKFAQDLNISAVELSQVVNNHREPKEEFILKLMIHSEKVYSHVCDFHPQIWYQIFFAEKLNNTMYNQKKWQTKLRKHVKVSEPLAKYSKLK
jgi:hypothetical protein